MALPIVTSQPRKNEEILGDISRYREGLKLATEPQEDNPEDCFR